MGKYCLSFVLALCAATHYLYNAFDHAHAALVWNISGAFSRSVLLVALALALKWRGPVLYVVAWWMAEEIMVIGCNAAFIVKPWVVPAGQDMCSSLLQIDLGRLGALVLAGFAMRQAMRDG